MTFLGQVLQIEERDLYLKIVVGVETGYNVDTYTIRLSHEKLVSDLEIGHKVLFTGYSQLRDGIEQFHVESFMKKDFTSCIKCGLPLTSYICFTKHDVEAQKLFGGWRVVHKIKSKGCVKLFFEKEHFVFAAVSSPQMWVHASFQELNDGDRVNLEGWRYRQKTTIKFIEKLRDNE